MATAGPAPKAQPAARRESRDETPTTSLQAALALHAWREIRGCPGRYVVSRALDRVAPAAMLGERASSAAWAEFPAPRQGRDAVCVAAFRDAGGGGLITYLKREGAATGYVHTLNTPSGLERKLRGMGLFDAVQRALDSRPE